MISTPNAFTPCRYIAIGATGAMFTLRESYLHTWYDYEKQPHHEERSYHVQNLGTTLDVAFPKAQKLTRAAGLRLTSTLEGLRDELRAITRRTPEQVHEAMMADRRRDAEFGLRRAETVDAELMCRMAKYPLWTFNFGQYKGQTIAEVAAFDRGYLEWMTDEMDHDFPTLFQLQIATWLENHPVAVSLESNHVGAVKERIEIQGLVNKRFSLPNSEWGSDLIKFTDDNGNVFVTFYSGTAWDPGAGDRVHVKATVKQHDVRDGVKQTIVGRVTAVKGK